VSALTGNIGKSRGKINAEFRELRLHRMLALEPTGRDWERQDGTGADGVAQFTSSPRT
jgi:hypothetical protein